MILPMKLPFWIVNPPFSDTHKYMVGSTSKILSNAHEIVGIIIICHRENNGLGLFWMVLGYPFHHMDVS